MVQFQRSRSMLSKVFFYPLFYGIQRMYIYGVLGNMLYHRTNDIIVVL
jgi:hypothetical protein